MSLITGKGVFLSYQKEAVKKGIVPLTEAGGVLLPLAFGDQAPLQPACEEGDTILRGKPIGLPDDTDTAPAICSVTGVYTGQRRLSHPLYGPLLCAAVDGLSVAGEPTTGVKEPLSLPPDAIIEIARRAGIVDEMDGQPLFLKLHAWAKDGLESLIVHAVDAEPYGCAGQGVLLEAAPDALAGLRLAGRVAGARTQRIAVMLPYKKRRRLGAMLGKGVLLPVAHRYPAQLPEWLRGPRTGLIGVQACLALYEAAAQGSAQCDGVITVAGDAVPEPANVRVPFGVTVETLLRFCGVETPPPVVVLGDAMTGIVSSVLDVPVLPGMTCLLAMTKRQVIEKSGVCIGCGRCAAVCHAHLLPYEIVRCYENMHYRQIQSLSTDACDGCGVCSYVCPAGREVAARVMEASAAHGTIILDWRDDDDG